MTLDALAYFPDTNFWIALTFDSHSHHREAAEAYSLVSVERPAVFCRSTQQSFLRIATTPAILRQYSAEPFTNQDALAALDHFLAMPTVTFWDEPDGLVPLWRRLASRPTTSPKVWMDSYLAAFAISGDLRIITFDHDFKSFASSGLKFNLLESK